MRSARATLPAQASRRRIVLLLLTFPLPALLTACGDSPAGPEPELEVTITGGDRQFGIAGQPLDQPLEVRVRNAGTAGPQGGVLIEWTVRAGAASIEENALGTTDADGRARVNVTLGSGTDTVRVYAAIHDHPESVAVFEAYVVDHPQVASLSLEVARGGETLTLTGHGFSGDPASNVVLFSGIRGRVLAADPNQIQVQVPDCLPPRIVGVWTQLGGLRSEPLPLLMADSGRVTRLDRGGYVDVDESQRIECLRLAGDGASYLVMAVASGTTGAARYDYVLSGLGEGPVVSTSGRPTPSPRTPPAPSAGAPFSARWEVALRGEEDRWVRAGTPHARTVTRAPGAPSAVPAVGDRRTFSVLNADGRFDQVTAVARVVSAHTIIYVDRMAPAGGFDDADLEAFAAGFDDVIHPTDTEAYGQPSDLDGNGRVVILFTPTVNGLTPRGAEGFVGGFFYGLDLLDRSGSNRGEVFYSVVPDPEGVYSDARGKAKILQVVPAVLAHEFQHMIHFNERVLKLGADRTEALWLSEGLAQMAEELVARAYDARGNFLSARHFREGNDDRAKRYLAHTDSASVIVATGQGSLAERGGGWLFTLYLWDVGGQDGVLARLTRTTLTGTANVSAVTGQTWKQVFAAWGAALYLDGLSGPGIPFAYPTVDLKERLSGADGPFPLAPEFLAEGDFTRTGSLWSSSIKHYIVIPPSAGSTVLRLGGAAGGNAPTEAGLRLRVVRIF